MCVCVSTELGGRVNYDRIMINSLKSWSSEIVAAFPVHAVPHEYKNTHRGNVPTLYASYKGISKTTVTSRFQSFSSVGATLKYQIHFKPFSFLKSKIFPNVS